MKSNIIHEYEDSIIHYQKAKEFLDLAEQDKNSKFHNVKNYLNPLLIKELRLINEISDYYLNGPGMIMIVSFCIEKNYVLVNYGLLGEDDIFPHSCNTFKLHLLDF